MADDQLATHAIVPITHGGVNRAYEVCKCADCGYTAKCTEFDDFYTRDSAGNGPLCCERCILRPTPKAPLRESSAPTKPEAK